MASNLDLPGQVKGIWADCGYSSPKEILCRTAQKRRLPVKPAWAMMRLGGRIFGRMDVAACTALDCVKEAKLPILIIHGEADEIVPHDMALALRDACAGPVTLVSVPGAPHGMSFYAGHEAYTAAVETLIFENL
jgi:fermentation-respiration switch protein FrsA (DUF1100 family)